jgi:hypothetical protein
LLRRVAVVLALLLLFAPLASAVHHLVVRHVTCPAHGEQLHVDSGDVSLAFGEPLAAGDEAAVGLATEASGHDHEECLVVAKRREIQGLGGADVTAQVSPPAVLRIARSPEPPCEVATTRLRLAPKTSPPA